MDVEVGPADVGFDAGGAGVAAQDGGVAPPAALDVVVVVVVVGHGALADGAFAA